MLRSAHYASVKLCVVLNTTLVHAAELLAEALVNCDGSLWWVPPSGHITLLQHTRFVIDTDEDVVSPLKGFLAPFYVHRLTPLVQVSLAWALLSTTHPSYETGIIRQRRERAQSGRGR